MSNLNGRGPHRNDDGIHYSWPHTQWNQIEDQPQPQGAVAAHGFTGHDDHDDILKDI